ncbi:sex hormone-binding globulin [Aulostomus maculatus]
MARGLLLIWSLTLLGWGAEGQGNGRGKTRVSGGATFFLGQHRDTWRPLIYTTVNLTEISDIKSSFQLRTYDPEGTVFYGDTKYGRDWFVLSLKDGKPLMQISRDGVLLNVEGGPKMNDGKWHTLEVSNQGDIVILEVDGAKGLVVGLKPKVTSEVMSGELRLALGGILIDNERMFVQFEPLLDGCVREGSWLNLSIPWETDADELWPCFQNIQPGSYFPGTGLAIFNTSVFCIEEEQGMRVELWGDFSQMDGTILSIRAPGEDLLFALAANNITKEVTLTFGDDEISMRETFKRLEMTFQADSLQVFQDGDESTTTRRPVIPGYLSMWRHSRMAVGGLLGEGEDNIGSQFLTGCLEKIQVQGEDLDLDLATAKHMAVTSHSCPV